MRMTKSQEWQAYFMPLYFSKTVLHKPQASTKQYLCHLLVCGTIKCPNFSQENDIDDDVDLSSTKIDKDEVQDNEVLKFVKSKGHRAIRSAMKV